MAGLCSPALLKERLPEELLEQIDVISSAKLFKKMIVRFQTQRWYKQNKYNLFREESEGYSKLITELVAFFDSPADSGSMSELSARVQSYIGYFNLDPNRVMGVILQCFERHASGVHDLDVLNLLRGFNRTSLCHVFGFKFHLSTSSPSLFRLAAFLISNQQIDLPALYAHLSPEDDNEMVSV